MFTGSRPKGSSVATEPHRSRDSPNVAACGERAPSRPVGTADRRKRPRVHVMQDGELPDIAIDYVCSVVANDAAAKILAARAAQAEIHADDGFVACLAWSWTHRPALAVRLAVAWIDATRSAPEQLPRAPEVDELLDGALHDAALAHLGPDATAALVGAIRSALER